MEQPHIQQHWCFSHMLHLARSPSMPVVLTPASSGCCSVFQGIKGLIQQPKTISSAVSQSVSLSLYLSVYLSISVGTQALRGGESSALL